MRSILRNFSVLLSRCFKMQSRSQPVGVTVMTRSIMMIVAWSCCSSPSDLKSLRGLDRELNVRKSLQAAWARQCPGAHWPSRLSRTVAAARNGQTIATPFPSHTHLHTDPTGLAGSLVPSASERPACSQDHKPQHCWSRVTAAAKRNGQNIPLAAPSASPTHTRTDPTGPARLTPPADCELGLGRLDSHRDDSLDSSTDSPADSVTGWVSESLWPWGATSTVAAGRYSQVLSNIWDMYKRI